jgi:hypothetical protein
MSFRAWVTLLAVVLLTAIALALLSAGLWLVLRGAIEVTS